jgi:hypothetical protein
MLKFLAIATIGYQHKIRTGIPRYVENKLYNGLGAMYKTHSNPKIIYDTHNNEGLSQLMTYTAP